MRRRRRQQTDKLLAEQTKRTKLDENGDANELAGDVCAFLHGHRAGQRRCFSGYHVVPLTVTTAAGSPFTDLSTLTVRYISRTTPRDWLGRTPTLCRVGRKTLSQSTNHCPLYSTWTVDASQTVTQSQGCRPVCHGHRAGRPGPSDVPEATGGQAVRRHCPHRTPENAHCRRRGTHNRSRPRPRFIAASRASTFLISLSTEVHLASQPIHTSAVCSSAVVRCRLILQEMSVVYVR